MSQEPTAKHTPEPLELQELITRFIIDHDKERRAKTEAVDVRLLR